MQIRSLSSQTLSSFSNFGACRANPKVKELISFQEAIPDKIGVSVEKVNAFGVNAALSKLLK
jgi:hypothetical protein